MDSLDLRKILEIRLKNCFQIEENKRREFLTLVAQNPDIDDDCNLYELVAKQRMMYDMQYELLRLLKSRLMSLENVDFRNFSVMMEDILLLDDNSLLEGLNLFAINFLLAIKKASDLDFLIAKDYLNRVLADNETFECREDVCARLIKDIKLCCDGFDDNYQKIKKKERSIEKKDE